MTVSHAAQHRPASPPSSGGAWRATLSGFSANMVGIGLARFAYTPLLPAIVGAHWFAPSTVAYLGAANLAGYLADAALARPLAARVAAPPTLNTMMMLATVAFIRAAPATTIAALTGGTALTPVGRAARLSSPRLGEALKSRLMHCVREQMGQAVDV